MAKKPADPFKYYKDNKSTASDMLGAAMVQKAPDKITKEIKENKDSKDSNRDIGLTPSGTPKDHQKDFKDHKDGKNERIEVADAIRPRQPPGPKGGIKEDKDLEKAKPEWEKAQQKESEKVKAEYEKGKEVEKVKPEFEKAHYKEAEKIKSEFEKQVKDKETKELAEAGFDPARSAGVGARGDGDEDHFIEPGQRPDLSGGALSGEAGAGKPARKGPSPRKR